MVFSSITFLIYFLPAFLLLYQLPWKRWKNLWLLAASILFYAWGAPKFLFVVLGTTMIDFFLVRAMDRSDEQRRRKLFLILSLTLNLGLLAYFKYANFFLENVSAVSEAAGLGGLTWEKIILPIGISFYTFETVTYVVDVYRRVHKPLSSFLDYQLYIMLFPKLIAGPIVRFHSIADQITERRETMDDRLHGFIRFCIGLGKKILIANVLGEVADGIMGHDPNTLSTASAWVGMIAYTFQIYFDFSGYSDMALGIGRMIGFHFPENFDKPYISGSITEFWRRWHISLGQWMKNYLYIPLGGNRSENKTRVYFNLWFVFLISGLWHGASWSFVLWGAYHGLFLILDRLFLLKFLNRIGSVPAALITFFIVAIGWMFFRIDDIGHAFDYIGRLFVFAPGGVGTNVRFDTTLIIAVVFAFAGLFRPGRYIEQLLYVGSNSLRWYFPMILLAFVLFTLCLATITVSSFNPFIYYRF